jgi:hypothetical protein
MRTVYCAFWWLSWATVVSIAKWRPVKKRRFMRDNGDESSSKRLSRHLFWVVQLSARAPHRFLRTARKWLMFLTRSSLMRGLLVLLFPQIRPSFTKHLYQPGSRGGSLPYFAETVVAMSQQISFHENLTHTHTKKKPFWARSYFGCWRMKLHLAVGMRSRVQPMLQFELFSVGLYNFPGM